MKIAAGLFLKAAAAIGASRAWADPARGSRVHWRERRNLYPQGVAPRVRYEGRCPGATTAWGWCYPRRDT